MSGKNMKIIYNLLKCGIPSVKVLIQKSVLRTSDESD